MYREHSKETGLRTIFERLLQNICTKCVSDDFGGAAYHYRARRSHHDSPMDYSCDSSLRRSASLPLRPFGTPITRSILPKAIPITCPLSAPRSLKVREDSWPEERIPTNRTDTAVTWPLRYKVKPFANPLSKVPATFSQNLQNLSP